MQFQNEKKGEQSGPGPGPVRALDPLSLAVL